MKNVPVITGYLRNSFLRVGDGRPIHSLVIKLHAGGWLQPTNVDYPVPVQYLGSYNDTEPDESTHDAMKWLRADRRQRARMQRSRERHRHISSDVVFIEWLALPPADLRTIDEYFDDRYVIVNGEIFARMFGL